MGANEEEVDDEVEGAAMATEEDGTEADAAAAADADEYDTSISSERLPMNLVELFFLPFDIMARGGRGDISSEDIEEFAR